MYQETYNVCMYIYHDTNIYFAESTRLGEVSARLFKTQLVDSRDAHASLELIFEFVKCKDYRAHRYFF